MPLERAQFAAPGSCGHRQPYQHAPWEVFESLIDDGCGLLRRWRMWVWRNSLRWLGLVERVDGDPVPANSALQGSAETPMNLADRGRSERAALMLLATRIAFVWTLCPVLDELFAAAVHAAGSQDLVEGIERLAVEFADRELAKQRPDVVVDVAFVALARVGVDVEQFKVSIHELIDVCLGARIALLVNLVDQANPSLLGVFLGGRSRWNGLGEVVPATAQRVDPGVHLDPQRSARQRLDLAARAALAVCLRRAHGATVDQLAPQIAPRDDPKIISEGLPRWSL
ncbi:hypothetical protein KALB_703 [Kutzneria albida DSM 43870]|uniref:Uncharacterized protein n=1 Tax=Kutzneria albida DSM 43870 TaxID=1449976 RepID=W5VYT1_9PSEU|nr:hypothetical protein KALB_703 [Kutzneria albida DSM 43870]